MEQPSSGHWDQGRPNPPVHPSALGFLQVGLTEFLGNSSESCFDFSQVWLTGGFKDIHCKAAVRISLLSLFSYFLAGSWKDLKLIQGFETSAVSLPLKYFNQAKKIFRLHYDLNSSFLPIICSLLSYNKHGVLEGLFFPPQISLRMNASNVESRA